MTLGFCELNRLQNPEVETGEGEKIKFLSNLNWLFSGQKTNYVVKKEILAMNKSIKWIAILVITTGLILSACSTAAVPPPATAAVPTIEAPVATEAPAIESAKIYIATITVPETAEIMKAFTVTWDCNGAKSAKLGQTGEKVLEPSGSQSFTLSVPAGPVNFDLSCVWEDGGTATQKGTVVMTDPVVVSACSLTDGTVEVQLTKSGNEWVADPANLKPVTDYNDTRPGHDASQLAGCDLWWQYEHPTEKRHVLVVGRDDPTQPISYLGSDGFIHIPQPKGGTLRAGPSGWNTGDMSTDKPSIALEELAARRANQIRNKYVWEMDLFLPNETEPRTYGKDHVFGSFYAGCTDLKEPAPINVAGTIVDDGFNASIGMEACRVAVKIDGIWTQWADARDNVIYHTVQAWLFPKDTTEAEIQTWIDSQK